MLVNLKNNIRNIKIVNNSIMWKKYRWFTVGFMNELKSRLTSVLKHFWLVIIQHYIGYSLFDNKAASLCFFFFVSLSLCEKGRRTGRNTEILSNKVKQWKLMVQRMLLGEMRKMFVTNLSKSVFLPWGNRFNRCAMLMSVEKFTNLLQTKAASLPRGH